MPRCTCHRQMRPHASRQARPATSTPRLKSCSSSSPWSLPACSSVSADGSAGHDSGAKSAAGGWLASAGAGGLLGAQALLASNAASTSVVRSMGYLHLFQGRGFGP